jgi:hypothetical protein
MKKLIFVLMVISMAALLFTGCFNTTTINTPPVITSNPVTAGTIGTAYTYTVTATDADSGDTLTYVVTGPTGMVISSVGVISGWTPAVAGTYAVTVTVSDGTDSVTQPFTITVPSISPAEIAIAVATETPADADGKVFVKGGDQEITVTFPAAVDNPVVKVGTVEVPVFTVDNKVFKGTGKFVGDNAVLIAVSGVCEELCAAKSVVVDSSKPYAELKAKVAECDCEDGYALTITSDWEAETECETFPGCCGDAGSGLASWNIKIYHDYPWDACCEPDPCVVPNVEKDGTICPITITKECIDEVFVPDVSGSGGHWEDFFDSNYWVIATLTDNVGNVMNYYGEVVNVSNPDGALGGELVSFVELHLDPTTSACTCPAEDPEAADFVIGDCDGTPTTECWEEPLEPCPVVTLDPKVPTVGEEVTITIDYDYTGEEAVKPTGVVSAYVGPYIKDFSTGIPEGARELVLTDNEDWSYTATYIFGQAGTDYIYVTDDCEDCTACKYTVTVLPIPPLECPDPDADPKEVIFVPESPLVGQETHMTFIFNRAPFADEDIRAFVGPAIKDMPLGVPDDAAVLPLVQDEKDPTKFCATYTFGSAGTDFIYLVFNCEDCTPCYYPITVTPIEDCPTIKWTVTDDNSADVGGVTYLRGGLEYTFTLTFDHVITDPEKYGVTIQDYLDLCLPGQIFCDYRVLADMTTTDNMVFSGTFTAPAGYYTELDPGYPGRQYHEYCTAAYVEVEVLEPADCCAPCMFKFGVDATLPKAQTEITAVDCCNAAWLEFHTTPVICEDPCCGDECTSVVSASIHIYDAEPVWDCCILQSKPAPICEHNDLVCPIEVEIPAVDCSACCLDTGDYWIITELIDAVGNVNNYYVKLTIGGVEGAWTLNPMIEYDWVCDYVGDGADSNPWDDKGKTTTTSAPYEYGDECPWGILNLAAWTDGRIIY